MIKKISREINFLVKTLLSRNFVMLQRTTSKRAHALVELVVGLVAKVVVVVVAAVHVFSHCAMFKKCENYEITLLKFAFSLTQFWQKFRESNNFNK